MINWKIICNLTDKEVLGTAGLSHKDPQKKSRAIVINEDGRYAVMYEEETNAYALPGGSIEPGEDEKSAIIREIYEETGCTCDAIKPLGIICENRYHADTTRLSYYFVVHTKTQQSTLHLTDEECKLGTTVKWCSLEEMLQMINDINHNTSQQKFQQARDMAAINEYLRTKQPINN